MDKEQLIQLIIHNKANDYQKNEFEKLVNTNLEFKKSYQDALDMRAALIKSKSAELRSLFDKLESTHRDKKQFSRKLSIKTIIPFVAAASILLFILLWNSSPSNDEIYNQYYTPYRNVIVNIERGETIGDDQVSRAFYNYESKNYAVAYKQFDSIYNQDNQSFYLFYQANAALGNEDYTSAIELYKKHQKLQDDFYARSRWYLALSYVKIGEKEKAILVLDKIIDNQSYNYKKAQSLLQTLKE